MTRAVKHLDSDRALLAGLVHDIGLIPLLRKAPQYSLLTGDPEAMERYLTALRPACSTHILRRWGFSDDLITAASQAQQCSRCHDHQSDYADIVIIAHLAALSSRAGTRYAIPFDRVPAVMALSRDMNSPFSASDFLYEAGHDITAMQELLRG